MSNNKNSINVLTVDDEPLILMSTVELLEDMGYTVFEANSGEAALTLARNNRVDLVITDQSMPNMTGSELITKLRDEGKDVPIILATGYSDLRTEPRDAIYVLVKPYSPKELETSIHEALGCSEN